MCVCVRACGHVRMCLYLHVLVHVYVSLQYICTYMCTYSVYYAFMSACVYVCVYYVYIQLLWYSGVFQHLLPSLPPSSHPHLTNSVFSVLVRVLGTDLSPLLHTLTSTPPPTPPLHTLTPSPPPPQVGQTACYSTVWHTILYQ